MEKEQKEIIATVIGVIILAAILFGNLSKKPSAKANAGRGKAAAPIASSAENLAPAVAALSQSADQRTLSLQKEHSEAAWGRDPFSSSKINREYQIGDIQLKGISFGSDHRGFAFINNEIVKAGDKVGDYEIIEVQKDRVLLKKGSQNFYRVLPKE